MAEVDINNPNLDGDFKALLEARKTRKSRESPSIVYATDELIQEDGIDNGPKETTKVDKLRELLFLAASNDDLQQLDKVVADLPHFNLQLSDPSLRHEKTNATALHVALECKSKQVSRYLIRSVGDDDYLCACYDVMVGSTPSKKTALHLLADIGDAALMAEFLGKIDDPKKKHRLLHGTTLMAVAGQRPRDFSAIHIAALEGHTDVLDYLTKQGVDVNLTNKKDDTAALWAARGNNLETMRLLIRLKANADHQNDKGSTPLYWAVRYGYADMVELLAKEGGANVNHRRKLGLVSPIVMASALGYADIVCQLLKLGADVNMKITNNQTALHYAAADGLDDVVRILLRNGADNDATDDTGVTPLHMATKNGHLSTMAILCAHDASVECRDKFGKTVWSYAMEADGVGALDVLVSMYKRRQGKNGRTLVLPADEAPLHEAARIGDLEKIKYIIAMGCDPNVMDNGGNTFLHIAARENQPNVLTTYQNSDAINKQNHDGDLPIHLAARRGHTEVIKVLLKKSKLNITNKLGYTALHDACSVRQVQAEAVAVIVKSMVDNNNWSLIDAKDLKGNTALHLAAICNHCEVIPELLPLNPSILNLENDNPFHAAAKRGNAAALDVMFDIFNMPGKGLDLEQENGEGETVLHICAKAGSIEMVNELIEAGADLAKRNKQGNTILHEMAEEIFINPDCTEKLLLVFNEVVACAPVWWCIKHELPRPDPNSDTFTEWKRNALVFLTSEEYNLEGFNVIGYCAKLGALPLFKAIMNTDEVSLMSKGKIYTYDVTNIMPDTCVFQRKRKISNRFSIASVGVFSDADPQKAVPDPAQSYLDIIVDMDDEVLATKFLDVVPVKQLSDNLWGAYQWIYITLMILHIVFMSCLSVTAIPAAGVLYNTSGIVDYTDPPTIFPYVLFTVWPTIMALYQIFIFVSNMIHYCRRRRSSRSGVQHGASGTPCKKRASFQQLINAVLSNISGITTFTFTAFIVAWYVYYLANDRNQVYFLAVAMILGWMLTIVFTKGFRSVHAFSTMLFYIIIRDVSRFITIYIFMLIGFSLAMHTLFQISVPLASSFSSPWDTIFLTFNLMLGMGDLFDEQFDQGFEDAGSSSLWVKIVFLFYMILATIIMLNLLIAMLSDTYNEIKRKEGTTWRVNSLRMALRIEKWMPILKKMATKLSLVHIATEFDKESQRWFMKIPAENKNTGKAQSVSEISKSLKRLEVDVDSMQMSYRTMQEQMDVILNHIKPGMRKPRVKTAVRRH